MTELGHERGYSRIQCITTKLEADLGGADDVIHTFLQYTDVIRASPINAIRLKLLHEFDFNEY